MKPYKIIRSEKSLWQNIIMEVSVTEKKAINLKPRLVANRYALPRDRYIAEKLKVIEI